jgi:hypothetical protein
MADGFVINDTSYAGEVASQFALKAITGADTINGGHVYVKDGIKKKFTIPRWDANYEDLIQDRTAMPTIGGAPMTVDSVSLQPADYMIFEPFNPRDFEDHWYATQLNPTLIDRALPNTVESVVVQGVMARHAKYFNKAIWNSDTSLADSSKYKYFDGLIKRIKTGSTAASTNVAGTTLTTSNIQAEMLKCYNNIPAALRYDPSMKFFVSYATYDLYAQSQINQTYKGKDITSEGVPTFKGRQVVKIADFPDDTMIVAKGSASMESNLWVGINSVSDEGLQLARLRPEGELFFIKMLMKADTQIAWGEETVYYGA